MASETDTIAASLPGQPLDLVATPDNIWVSTQDPDTGRAHLLALDSTTGSILIDKRDLPVVTDLQWAYGSLWGSSPSGILRLAGDSGALIERYETTGGVARSISVADGALWVAMVNLHVGSDSLIRIDPISGDMTARHLDGFRITDLAGAVDRLWVLNASVHDSTVGSATIVQVDTVSGEVRQDSDLPVMPLGLVASPSAAYAVSWSSSLGASGTGKDDVPVVVRVDAASGDVTFGRVSEGFALVGLGSGDLWAVGAGAGGGDALLRLDPTSLEIVDEIALPFEAVRVSLEPTGSRAWVASEDGLVVAVPLE